MKHLRIIVALLFITSRFIFGGEIFGSVSIGKKPVGKNVKVEIKYGKKVYKTRTNPLSTYSVFVQETGKCKIRIPGVKGILTLYSKNKPVRANLVIIEYGDSYRLR